MIDVKLTMPAWPITRQTPGQTGIWNHCRFFYGTDIDRCDYWFVMEGLDAPKEQTVCPKDHTILITCEPPTVKIYRSEFLRQFASVITCHRNIDHPNPVFQQPGLPWHIGRRQINHVTIEFSKDYDELKAMASIPKTRLLSVISSSKTMSKGHRKRLDFAKRLKHHFGDQVDLFGRGVHEIEDKWDALATYKYHVVLENSAIDDYWTEKLADAFLAGCYPIYYGCPNIDRYFDPASLTSIDLDDSKGAITTIEACMNENKYESSQHKIWEARGKVLDRYNLFPLIAEYIEKYSQCETRQPLTPTKVTIRKEISDSNLICRIKRKLLRL